MSVRLPTYAAVSLVLVFASASACNRGASTVTSPDTTTNLKASLSVEPTAVRPDFLTGFTCAALPAFGAQLTVIVGGDDLIVRGIRFSFTDRVGRTVIPDAFPTAPVTSLPITFPIPPGGSSIPTNSPIPVPGFPSFNGSRIVPNSRLTQPFLLRFGCDVAPEGTIVVVIDTSDVIGRTGRSEVRVSLR
jgi:hypothetical protein